MPQALADSLALSTKRRKTRRKAQSRIGESPLTGTKSFAVIVSLLRPLLPPLPQGDEI